MRSVTTTTVAPVEIRITVTVEPTVRHAAQPLTRAQVDHVAALREQIEAAVEAVLERAVGAAPERRSAMR